MELRILEIIRDAADPIVASPEDCLMRLRMDRRDFVKAIGDLQKRSLVDIDQDSDALRLTEAGSDAFTQREDAAGSDPSRAN